MSQEKTCSDYALVTLGRGFSYRGSQPMHIVEHQGRTVFETESYYDACMFAAELYLKIKRLEAP